MKKRLIIGATGASGIPILIQCLKLVQEQKDFESYLVMTDSAKLTLEHETKMKVEEVEKLADHVLDSRDRCRTSQWIISDGRDAHCPM